MSVAVLTDASSYLEQTSVGGPGVNSVLPDVSSDFTIFLWLNNLLPAVVLPAYKLILGLWTDADWDPDYANPSIKLMVVQSMGGQYIQLALGDDSLSTTPVTSGVEKRALAIGYNATTHNWTLRLQRPLTTSGWEHSGDFTSDFSSTPLTVMRLLNDGIGSTPALSAAYFRVIQGSVLTDDQLNVEVVNAVSQTAGIAIDTPLISDTDITDVSGNANSWNMVGSGFSTILPGPLAGDPIFVVCPETTACYVQASQSAVLTIIPAP